jgi:hypothetical protein
VNEQQLKNKLLAYFRLRDSHHPMLAHKIELELREYAVNPVIGQTALFKSCEMTLAGTESDVGTSATTKA